MYCRRLGFCQGDCLVEDDAVLHRVKVDLDAVIVPELLRNRAQLCHRAGHLAQEGLQLRVHLWYLHAGHHISAEEKPLLWRCRAPDIVQ